MLVLPHKHSAKRVRCGGGNDRGGVVKYWTIMVTNAMLMGFVGLMTWRHYQMTREPGMWWLLLILLFTTFTASK